MGTNNPRKKDRKISGKIGIARGGKKLNITIRGRGSHLKASTNSRVSLADSMKWLVNIISTDLTNKKGSKSREESILEGATVPL